MIKKNPSFATGLLIGVLAGALVTGGGLAHSGMGKKAWGSFGRWFKAGYVLGFVDAVRLAKQTDMGGYIATTYKLPNKAPWPKWVEEIDRLYAEPKHDKMDVPSLIVLAGPVLVEEYGLEPGSDTSFGLEQLKEALRKKKEAEKVAASEEAGAKAGGPGADEDPVESDSPPEDSKSGEPQGD